MNNSSDEFGQLHKAIRSVLDDKGTTILKNNVPLPDKSSSIVESYGGENWHDVDTEEYSLVVSDAAINDHIDYFNIFFRPFMDDLSGLIGVNSVIRGETTNTPISVSEFLKNHIFRASLFLGPKTVTNMLVDWKNTKQLNYTSKYYFQGINVNSKLSIEGLGELLPPDRKNFDTKIINSNNKDLECGEGAIATIKNKISPVFYKPDTLESNSNVQLVDSRKNMMDFRDCLSLVLNRFITLNSWWLFDKNLKPFFSNNSISIMDTSRRLQNTQKLVQSNVDEAKNLMYDFVKMQVKFKRLNVAIQRWIKSKNSNEEYEIYSNLRTALDSIFTNEGETGTSDKLAITSSKYLRTDSNEKLQMYKLIKNFHKCASLIIHGDQYNDKTKELLKKININSVQGICSEAIIKILKSGKIPYWVPIALE